MNCMTPFPDFVAACAAHLAALQVAHPDGPPADVREVDVPSGVLTPQELQLLQVCVYGRAFAEGIVDPQGRVLPEALAGACSARADQVSALFAGRSPGASGARHFLAWAGLTWSELQRCGLRLALVQQAADAGVFDDDPEDEVRADLKARTEAIRLGATCMGGDQ
ncbi:hypothetical protein [Roseibium suaedae]|uniref:Uncharacterized protein n=1 Tax=Roseibium suaedae TaxID=735517 RepID=A0A1M7PMF9_9HYPH|nr:hypothetical protein [Roseibium suaedae]SHN18462.1 hypothetical protein SAMN05444272_4516 [Roseibium suaedae]